MKIFEKKILVVPTIVLSMIMGVALLGVVSADADTLELRDGSKINGSFVGGSQNIISLNVDGKIKEYSRDYVVSLTFNAPTPPPAPQAAEPVARSSGGLVVPAGSRVMVRMKDSLDSKKHKTGHRFTMAVESDIVEQGKVLIPRGTIAYGRLAESKQAGRVKGKSEMLIEVTDFMINNQMRPVVTQDIKAVTDKASSGKKSTRKVLGGAVIGGLIDGSSGAKTGAAVGAGASVLTKGDSINIPSGTLIEFRLAAPFQP